MSHHQKTGQNRTKVIKIILRNYDNSKYLGTTVKGKNKILPRTGHKGPEGE
jgi:hypothetical protein